MELAMQIAGPYENVLAAANWAEARGLAALALPDHYLYGPPDAAQPRPAPDALIQFGGLARETERIPLVSLVSPVTFRHPAVHAKSAITIDRMSGGRFTMGLGTGWMDAEHEVFGIPYPDMSTRFEMLEEQLAYLRAARDGRSFAGAHYRLRAFDLQPRPTGPLPLLVGGAGPRKTPRLAGLYADEFNAYARPPDMMAERIATAHSYLAEAGRNKSELFISTACVAVVGATQAEYDQRKIKAAKLFGVPIDEIEQRLVKAGAVHGTRGQVAETLAAWEAIGVERYYVQAPGDGEAEWAPLYDLLEAALP